MNFSYNLNEVFPNVHEDIVKIGYDLVPTGSSLFDGNPIHQIQHLVSDIIDTLGIASARAQSLKAPITSGDKLRSQSEHTVSFKILPSSDSKLYSIL